MRRIFFVICLAALSVTTAVEVIAWTKIGPTKKHDAAPVIGISVALPSGMKSFPVELPE